MLLLIPAFMVLNWVLIPHERWMVPQQLLYWSMIVWTRIFAMPCTILFYLAVGLDRGHLFLIVPAVLYVMGMVGGMMYLFGGVGIVFFLLGMGFSAISFYIYHCATNAAHRRQV